MPTSLCAHAGLLFAGLASFIVMGAGQSIYGPALPSFSRNFGIGMAEARLIVSAHWVGCAVGVATMFVAPGTHPRIGLAAMATGAALVAASLGWVATLAGAALFGAGYGGSTVAFNPRFLHRFAGRGPAMVSILNAAFGIGAILAPLAFVALGASVPLSFGLIAALCALVWLGAGGAGPAVAARAGEGFRPDPGFLSFGVLAIGIEASLIGLGPAALIDLGLAETRAAELLSLFFVVFLGVRLALVAGSRLLAPFALFTTALGIAGVAGVGAVLVSPGAFFVAMGAAAGLFFPAFYVCATVRMGDDPRVAPTIVASGLVGGIAAPPLLGIVLTSTGGAGFFTATAGLALAASGVALVLRPAINRRHMR